MCAAAELMHPCPLAASRRDQKEGDVRGLQSQVQALAGGVAALREATHKQLEVLEQGAAQGQAQVSGWGPSTLCLCLCRGVCRGMEGWVRCQGSGVA